MKRTYHGTIVPQKKKLVKGEKTDVLPAYKTNRERWNEKKRFSLQLVEKMQAANMDEGRITRMMHCAEYIEFTRCHDCGTYHIAKASLCRDRLCPTCAWRLALKRYAEMSRLMDALGRAYPEYYYSFVTLTVRNCKLDELKSTLSKMQTAWNRLRQRKCFKQACIGSARSIEITRNAETGEYHPHIHLITMWADDRQSSAPVLAARLVRAWIECAEKEGLVISQDAQKAETIIDDEQEGQSVLAAVVETFKYAVKPDDLGDIPARELRIFAAQIAGLRFISFTGLIKDYARKCAVEVETVDDTVEETQICEKCRSKNIDTILYKWCFGENRYIASSDDCDRTARWAEKDDIIRAAAREGR